jgi:misacylated tRNA(Ala) deacylase
MYPCLRDPWTWTLSAVVETCEPIEGGQWDVVLDTSPFYPEGGGQPADLGWIGDAQVLDVQVVDGVIRHRIDAPVEGPVQARVDGVRRLDHMQQHSAQHLISALAEDRHGLATVGFHLGAESTTIDFDKTLTASAQGLLTAAVDEAIQADHAITSREVEAASLDGLGVRSRGLPDGITGPVRLVEIADLDRNTCGGTHVSSTAGLQLVVFHRTERHKGGTRLSFLAGGRAVRALRQCLSRQDALSRMLTAGPSAYVGIVESLLQQAKDEARRRKALLAELGDLLGAGVAANPSNLQHLHRPEADAGLLRRVADTALAERPELLLLLTGGDGAGVFLLAGPADEVARRGAGIAAKLDGRGGGRKGRFQGKGARVGAAAGRAALEAGSGSGPGSVDPV